MNDDVQLTSTTSPDFGNVKSAYQQPVQTKMSVHCFGTNVVECYSPAQAKQKTRYTNPDNLIRDQNYCVTAAEPRRGARQQHRVLESVTCASADLGCQPLAGSAEWDDPVECEEQMCKSDYLISGVPQDCQNDVSVCENGNTAGAQLTAGLQRVYCAPQQVKHAQKGTGSNRPAFTQSDPNRTYNHPYNLGLSEQGNYQAKPLQENITFTNGHYVTQEHQNRSHLQNSSPSSSFVLRKKSCDDDGIQCFQRTIARAMKTFDINSCDKDPRNTNSTLMPQRRHEWEPHGNYKPHMIDENDREACFELTEGGLSPIVRQTDITSSVGNAYGEYGTQDEPVVNFQVSDKTGTEESSSRLPFLFAPVKKEIEDMIYDNSRLNLSEESIKHSAAITTQKPTYSLRNRSSFHMCEIGDSDNKAYVQNQQSHHFKTTFLNDEDNSFRLSDYLTASNQDSVPDPHGHPTGPGFGLFSTKAQRPRDIFSTSDENHIQSLNNTMEECSRNGCNLIYNDKQRSNFKISLDGLLSTGDTTDGNMNPDLLPFSVSKELRKHIKKHNTQDLHNPARFLAQGNQNSVRVSRQPDYGNSQTHLRNCDSLAAYVHSQMRNPVIQQEVLNCSRESGTSLHQNVGQIRNPIKQQDVVNCSRKSSTSLHQNVGQMQNLIKQPEVLDCTREPDTSLLQTVGQVGNKIIQDFQDYKREPSTSLRHNVNQMRNVITQDGQSYAKEPNTSLLQNTNHTWTRNPLTSNCVLPTSRYSVHTTEPTRLIPCHQTHFTFESDKNQQVKNYQKLPSSYNVESNRTHSPSDFARGVTAPGLLQHCPPTNSNGIQAINLIRQADMPYTPRHRVTVGLAQPFRRQNASVGKQVLLGSFKSVFSTIVLTAASSENILNLWPPKSHPKFF